jgi:hypothetical protein
MNESKYSAPSCVLAGCNTSCSRSYRSCQSRQFFCDRHTTANQRDAEEKQSYQMMMEIPSVKDASARTQVVVKASCVYTILSGDAYRAGLKCTDYPPEHRPLLESWGG